MCILFTYSNADPLPGGYKLILASNRDEYYARPASPAAEWQEDSCIVGGEFLLNFIALTMNINKELCFSSLKDATWNLVANWEPGWRSATTMEP